MHRIPDDPASQGPARVETKRPAGWGDAAAPRPAPSPTSPQITRTQGPSRGVGGWSVGPGGNGEGERPGLSAGLSRKEMGFWRLRCPPARPQDHPRGPWLPLLPPPPCNPAGSTESPVTCPCPPGSVPQGHLEAPVRGLTQRPERGPVREAVLCVPVRGATCGSPGPCAVLASFPGQLGPPDGPEARQGWPP